MSILTITHPLNSLLMILAPIGLAWFLVRRFGLTWRLVWIGAVGFLLSQVAHIPANLLIGRLFTSGFLPQPSPAWELPVYAAIGGLSAGLCEEVARYAVYRWWAREARTWPQALLLGSGHGGVESVLVGLLALLNVISLFSVRGADLSTLVPAEQLAAAEGQVAAFWSMPWPLSLQGAVERILTLPVQIGLSVLVLQVFARRQIRWLWLAIAWHAAIDALIAGYLGPVLLPRYDWAPYAIEGAVAVTSAISLALIWLLRPRGSQSTSSVAGGGGGRDPASPSHTPVGEATKRAARRPIAETDESLEGTRYDD